MTGNDMSDLRNALGLGAPDMANLLGVSQSTVYRWEAAGKKRIRIDPMQDRIVTILQQQLAERRQAQARAEFAETLGRALLLGGGMFALYKLLEQAFDSKD